MPSLRLSILVYSLSKHSQPHYLSSLLLTPLPCLNLRPHPQTCLYQLQTHSLITFPIFLTLAYLPSMIMPVYTSTYKHKLITFPHLYSHLFLSLPLPHTWHPFAPVFTPARHMLQPSRSHLCNQTTQGHANHSSLSLRCLHQLLIRANAGDPQRQE